MIKTLKKVIFYTLLIFVGAATVTPQAEAGLHIRLGKHHPRCHSHKNVKFWGGAPRCGDCGRKLCLNHWCWHHNEEAAKKEKANKEKKDSSDENKKKITALEKNVRWAEEDLEDELEDAGWFKSKSKKEVREKYKKKLRKLRRELKLARRAA